jgi:WD40 repeat protein
VTADGRIRIWNATTGALLVELEDPDQMNYAPAFSPDGSRVVVCGENVIPRVWDAATGKVLLTLNYIDHTRNPPWIAEFSPDGRRILTTRLVNEPIQLWDGESGDELLTLDGSATCAHFSPDGTRILSPYPPSPGGLTTRRYEDEGGVVIYDSRAVDRAALPKEVAPRPRAKP